MKRKQFKEKQIIAVLREHEAGAKTADLAHKPGTEEATLSIWKVKYDGMDVSHVSRLRELEAKNARLEKLLAEQIPDASAMTGKRFAAHTLTLLARIHGIGSSKRVAGQSLTSWSACRWPPNPFSG